MQLSDRLLALAQMVPAGNTLADVGCDHGYIPIYLVEKGIVHRAIAMDVGKGPLSRAVEHISSHGLQEKIATRLADGLTCLSPGECDRITIAGMGGPLMEKILAEGDKVIDFNTELVVQPQSHISHFRQFLMEHGYEILQENMIYEDGKYYPMMRIRRGKGDYDELSCRYGPLLLEDRHPVLKDYLQKEIKALHRLEHKLEKNTSAAARLKEIREELQMAESAVRRYDS